MARPMFSRLVLLVTAVVVSQALAFAQVSESRPAIPTPEMQKEKLAQLDESLGLSKLKTTADKQQAITQLMELVDQSSESPDDLYVSLTTVIPLIRETSDFAAHQIAVQKLTETFSIEPLQDQTQQLLLFINACKSKESLTPAVEELAGLAHDWTNAMPLLAQGSDPLWQAAATAERAADEAVESQLKVADAWWEIAKATGPAQPIVRQRLLDLYTKIAPAVTKPITKTQVKKRIDELTAHLTPTTPAAPVTRKLVPKPKAKKDENELPVGEPIDLLAMVKLPEHAVMGDWKRVDDDIVCGQGRASRLFVPVAVTGSFRVEWTFTVRSAVSHIAVLFPVGDSMCEVCVSDQYAGMQCIDEKLVTDILGSQAAIRRMEPLANGIEHRLLIMVTQLKDTVGIAAEIDGERFVSWEGLSSQLTTWHNHTIPNQRLIGVFSDVSLVEVHKLELQLTSKRSLAYRLGDDWKNPLMVVTDMPSKEVAKEFPLRDWNGNKYLINNEPMSLHDARLLASQVKGRLLTISSKEEQDFIVTTATTGSNYWLSGWCAIDRKWRDDRNRPLKYFKWRGAEPNNHFGQEVQIMMEPHGEWIDCPTSYSLGHACIEWGEEYPDGP